MKTSDFEDLMQGLKEAAAHARGEEVPGIRVHIPAEIDTRAIRARLGLSQPEFAARYGFSPGAVRDWEQGRKVPEESTRAYLKVIGAAPAVVAIILGKAR